MNGSEATSNSTLQKIGDLQKIISDFSAQNLIPKIGIELEFYLFDNDSKPATASQIEKFIATVDQKLSTKNLAIALIEKEQGISQIEIKTLPYLDITKLCSDINLIKEITQQLAEELSLHADFSALPLVNDCSNALQINLSLIDQKNNFLFAKKDSESQIMLHAIGGMLQMAKELLIYCAPQKQDLQRHDLELNRQLFKKGKFTAPVNICWGYNNRTALVRVPSNKDSERRIEFRLASANADIFLVTINLLKAVRFGITEKINPSLALYGNAFDEKYDLELLVN